MPRQSAAASKIDCPLQCPLGSRRDEASGLGRVGGIRLARRSANREGPKVRRGKFRSNLSRLGEQVVGRTIPELGPQRDFVLLPETVEPQPKTGNVWARRVMIEREASARD